MPALGYGLLGLSGGYGKPPSDEERYELLDKALDLEDTFWDTAKYGHYHSTLTLHPCTVPIGHR